MAWNNHKKKIFRPARYRPWKAVPLFGKIGVGLIALLLAVNAVTVLLLLRAENRSAALAGLLESARSSLLHLEEALSRTDLPEVRRTLARARETLSGGAAPGSGAPATTAVVVAAGKKTAETPEHAGKKAPPLVAPPEAPQAPAARPAVPVPAPPATGEPPGAASAPRGDEVPSALVLATDKEHLLVCEKDTRTLHLYQYRADGPGHVKSYPCIIGANHRDKQTSGDLATPVGAYFFLRRIPGEGLPDRYGEGAFVLNYPNLLDRREKKDGNGIWLHGHAPGKLLGDPELQNTKGCIVVDNAAFRELSGFLRPSGGGIVVVNRVQAVPRTGQMARAQDARRFLHAWAQAWESGDTGRYLSFYSSDFVSGSGMRFEEFRRHKVKVNRGKTYIKVRIEDVAMLMAPSQGGAPPVAAVRFSQKYRSSNYNSDARKIFYLRQAGSAGWKVIGESLL